jgi:hypothetical protein
MGKRVKPAGGKTTDESSLNGNKNLAEVWDKIKIARIEFIIESWSRGFRRRVIVEMAIAKFNISQMTAYRDFHDAEQELAQLSAERRDILVGQSVALMNTVIRKAVTKKDLNSVIGATKHRDNVLGLTGKIELSGNIRHDVTETFELSEKTRAAVEDWARTAARSRTGRGKP